MNQSRAPQPPPRAPTMQRQPSAPASAPAARPGASSAPGRPAAPAAAPQRSIDLSGYLDVIVLGGFDGWKGRMTKKDFDLLFMNLLAGSSMVIATPLSVTNGPDPHQNDSFYILHANASVMLRPTSPNPGEKLALSRVFLAEELLEQMTAAAAKQGG